MTVFHPRKTSGGITWEGVDYSIASDGSIDCPRDVEIDLAHHLAAEYDVPIEDVLPAHDSAVPNNADTTVPDLTREELYERAQEEGIEGRSSMTKQELADALQED